MCSVSDLFIPDLPCFECRMMTIMQMEMLAMMMMTTMTMEMTMTMMMRYVLIGQLDMSPLLVYHLAHMMLHVSLAPG